MVRDLLTLLPGLWTSVQLLAASLALGLPLGLFAGYALYAWRGPVRWLVVAVTEVGRGFPALVTLYLVYFGLPELDLTLSAFASIVTAFAFTTASYTAEIFRAAIAAVPQGQREAAAALGLGRWKTLRLVVLPQALHIVAPPIIGFSIVVFQGTALAFAIGERELLSRAYDVGTLSFRVLEALLLAAAVYAVVSLLLAGAANWVRNRSGHAHATRIKPS